MIYIYLYAYHRNPPKKASKPKLFGESAEGFGMSTPDTTLFQPTIQPPSFWLQMLDHWWRQYHLTQQSCQQGSKVSLLCKVIRLMMVEVGTDW